MNAASKLNRRRLAGLQAFTRLELLAIIAGVALIVVAALPPLLMSRAKKTRIGCVNNLKNIGLAFRIFPTDQDGYFPWNVDTNRDGTIHHVTNPAALWRHLAAISNEIGEPRRFICPSDRERRAAGSWTEFTNKHFVSYALGFSATEEAPQSILSADRNIRLDGAALANAIISFPSNAVVSFDRRIHNEAGNILFGDGSVRQVPSRDLSEVFREALQATGTNVLAFP